MRHIRVHYRTTPFSTLGGHRRYPAAKIRELAEELREETTA
jgi:hypothetical protein